MAKVITQDTFDAVVKENMVDFEMDVDPAIQEAIAQFEAQGVNLLNIIKDPALYAGGANAPTKHAVIDALTELTANLALESMDEAGLKTNLDTIRVECGKDLARRVMAGKNNAYKLLLGACKKAASKRELLKEILTTWVSLCAGQPDLLDTEGMNMLLQYLKMYSDAHDVEMLTLTMSIIYNTCHMHEQNRQDYVDNGLIPLLVESLDKNSDKGQVVIGVCRAMGVLINDDDPRAVFGKGHEHAKMIVTEGSALEKIMKLANDYKFNGEVLGKLFLTLSRLSVRDEFCAKIMDLGGVTLIVEALENNLENKELVRLIMIVIKTIAGNDDVKTAIVAANGAQLILIAMDKYNKSPRVAEYACAAIASIVLRNTNNCQQVMEANGAETIVKAMQLHPKDEMVQKKGCMAVRNLVARTQEYCKPFTQAGAEAVIQNTYASLPTCKDEAHAALRDLGCDVKMRELWKGEGVSLSSES